MGTGECGGREEFVGVCDGLKDAMMYEFPNLFAGILL